MSRYEGRHRAAPVSGAGVGASAPVRYPSGSAATSTEAPGVNRQRGWVAGSVGTVAAVASVALLSVGTSSEGPVSAARALSVNPDASAQAETSQADHAELLAHRVEAGALVNRNASAARDAAAQQAAADLAQRQADADRAAREAQRQSLITNAKSDPRGAARALLGDFGFADSQFSCLDSLWRKESNWSYTATNRSSGAYGIPQALPGSKMASVGSDYRINPITQIKWGLGYIRAVYGTPCSAWAHSQRSNWY